MKTKEEYREEARRLISLSPRELEVERIAIALELGDEAESSAVALQKMDNDFLEVMTSPQTKRREVITS